MMLELNRSTAMMLRIGIYAGLAISIVGLALSMMDGGDDILYAGIFVLIISPFLGLIVSLISLVLEKDWRWAAVAAVLVTITVIGAIFSI